MSLTTPLSVQKLQTALHDKAKGSPKFRFYAVYDKVYRENVVTFAYECCKPRLQQATSVVVCQAQSDVGDQAVFEGLPTQRAGSSPP